MLPLSTSMHSGVGPSTWQPAGESTNLVRMRNQSLGQSAPSLTAGLVCFDILHNFKNFLKKFFIIQDVFISYLGICFNLCSYSWQLSLKKHVASKYLGVVCWVLDHKRHVWANFNLYVLLLIQVVFQNNCVISSHDQFEKLYWMS